MPGTYSEASCDLDRQIPSLSDLLSSIVMGNKQTEKHSEQLQVSASAKDKEAGQCASYTGVIGKNFLQTDLKWKERLVYGPKNRIELIKFEVEPPVSHKIDEQQEQRKTEGDEA